MRYLVFLFVVLSLTPAGADDLPTGLAVLMRQHCFECHDRESAEGGLDLSAVSFDLQDQPTRDRWIRIHDRIAKREMPPKAETLPTSARSELESQLATRIEAADRADVVANGRGPMRRLNRDEFEQNLRDLLQLPYLDIRDVLPEDREGHHFNKYAGVLDISRVQLTAYLDATDIALRQAIVTGAEPPPVVRYRAVGTLLFPERSTFGEREAMFFAKDSHAIEGKPLEDLKDDPSLELALFRSAHWPYYGYPQGFIARLPGEYRVRFSARSVLQLPGFELKPGTTTVPMTFRARKPSGPDVSGDVRATGGIMDISPNVAVYETVIRLRDHETFEYSLLGLPVPLARNVDGGPPTYRYPPFPEGGQPGVAFQSLEVEGPLPPTVWPPSSHRVLFDDVHVDRESKNSVEEARRLLRRFVQQAAREPVSEDVVQRFEQLVLRRLEANSSFQEALLAGYKAFLCSGHFLYLREPHDADDHFAIAERLSHFLNNSRADVLLTRLALDKKLRDTSVLRRETERLIGDEGFNRFVKSFTDYWLNLRHIRRNDPDIRLYPEYRFDDYLVESMAQETETFFRAMVRENLSSRVLVDADFIFANDRLARHYQLSPVSGSAMRKVPLDKQSPYGGLLTQASILKVTANGTSTSPVIRGAWIMDRLIGEPPPPPPANVPAVEPDIRGAKTIRELLALHTSSATCAACHAKFDPVGLALENFDILGGWRERYRGIESGERVTGIDRAGHDFSFTLSNPVEASGTLLDGQTFRNIRDLKAILAADPRQLARNLLCQLTVYATGVPVRFSDRAEIESILTSCESDGFRVRDLIVALVQSKILLGQPGCR